MMWPFTRKTSTKTVDAERAAELREEAAAQLDHERQQAIERRRLADSVRGRGRQNGFSEAMEALYANALGVNRT